MFFVKTDGTVLTDNNEVIECSTCGKKDVAHKMTYHDNAYRHNKCINEELGIRSYTLSDIGKKLDPFIK